MEQNIEVRYLETIQHLVIFFEMSEDEIRELVVSYPFPDGQTIENFKLTPKDVADWFENAWLKKNPPRKIG
jgi:hypothetical protein